MAVALDVGLGGSVGHQKGETLVYVMDGGRGISQWKK